MSAALYLTVALGFSFPLPRQTLNAAGKDATTPFPCMNSPCGCRSADHCWHNCCCHTLAERIQWARENHVRPPDDVLAEAKAEGIEWDSVAEDTCRCEASAECHDCQVHPTRASGHSHTSGGIVLIKALECQGLSVNWLTSVVSLPAPSVARWSFEPNLPTPIAMIADVGTSFLAEPPTPPPRRGA